MSFKAFVWAWQQTVPNADHHHILLALANISPAREVRASVPYIAGLVNRSPRKVRAAIAWLEEAEILTIQPRPGMADLIRLNIPSEFQVVMDDDDQDLEKGTRGRPKKTPAPHEKPLSNPCKTPAPRMQTNLIEPREPQDISVSARDPFEEWWGYYPRKVAKVAARKAWCNTPSEIAKDGVTLPELMELTRLFAGHVSGRDPDHIPHPATWLNGKRWNDEIPTRSQTDERRAAILDPGAQRNAARIEAMEQGAREALARRKSRWSL